MNRSPVDYPASDGREAETEAVRILKEVISEARAKGETSIAAQLVKVYELLSDPTRRR